MRRTKDYYIIRAIILSSSVYVLMIVGMAYSALKSPVVEEEEGIYIEFENFIPKPLDLTQIPENELSSEDRRNIAVNQAMKSTAETDPYDYSDVKESDDAYKEQLVKDAISDDEYEKIFERDDLNFDSNIEEEKIEEKEQTEDKPSNFQGATYISYTLKDRYKLKIPVPTYRCEGSGKVTINIVVNRDGKVISNEITANSSSDLCLREAALKSVKSSKFNQNYDAPLKQRGTITYIFEAQ